MGIHIMAGKGSGKSRLMGRVIGWQDFARGVPLVIFDPMGSTIDNLLDKITRLPPPVQRKLWQRVRYVDMSGREGYVVPFPLYYRLGRESHFEIAGRFVDVVRKIDPHLEKAPILGLNAFVSVGTHVGMVLSALGGQITDAEDLLARPKGWEERIREAVERVPEIEPAARFFLGRYGAMSPSERDTITQSFLAKVSMFSLDPSMRAMFGAVTQGIDWGEVIERRQAVLLDFRSEHTLERRRFKMMWAFSYLMDYIKFRGRTRSAPVSVIIDELTELTDFDALGVNPFEKELNALINVYARNCMVWLTIAHQESFQVSQYTLKTLMTMGTQVLGVTSDMEAALSLGRQYFPIDPRRVKRYEPVWMKESDQHTRFGGVIPGEPFVVDHRPVEYSPEEQQLMAAEMFKRLGLFEFLVRMAGREGDVGGGPSVLSIRNFDAGQWVNERLVAEARSRLAVRDGVAELRAQPVSLPSGDLRPERVATAEPSASRSGTMGENDQSGVRNKEKSAGTDRHPELDDVEREEA